MKVEENYRSELIKIKKDAFRQAKVSALQNTKIEDLNALVYFKQNEK